MLAMIFLLTAFGITFTANANATGTGKNSLPPNELGCIMILEYHLIGYPEADWRRTPENFRKDLQMLYDKEHPDFPLTATFYVLPAIDPGLRLFGQEEYIKQKLEFLVKHGYEIGNHSYWHQNLAKTDDAGVQKQLALCVKAVQSYLPGYEMRSLSLPFGVFAKNPQLEVAGAYEGTQYRHNAIVLVGSGSVPSPFSKSFNPFRLERIQAGDTPWGPKAFVERYKKDPSLRFVSDGKVNTITVPKGKETDIPAAIAVRYKVLLVEPLGNGKTK